MHSLDVFQKFGDCEAKALGKYLDQANTGIPLAILDLRNMRAVHTGDLGQVGLVPPVFCSQRLQAPSDAIANVICHSSRVALSSTYDVGHLQHHGAAI